jgi:hypothetical protein
VDHAFAHAPHRFPRVRGRGPSVIDAPSGIARSEPFLRDLHHQAQTSVGANGIRIAYQTFGAPSRPALMLVGWDDGFCRSLAGCGYHMIRFDNRDVGHSLVRRSGRAQSLRADRRVLRGRPVAAPHLLKIIDAIARHGR